MRLNLQTPSLSLVIAACVALVGYDVPPVSAGETAPSATETQIAERVSALGLDVRAVEVGPETIRVQYDNPTEHNDLVAFGAALHLVRQLAPAAAVLDLSATRNGTTTVAMKTRLADADAVTADLLSAQQLGAMRALLATATPAEGPTPAARLSDAQPTVAEGGPPQSDAVADSPSTRANLGERPPAPPLGATFHGPTGLLRTPSAEVLPEGSARLSITSPKTVSGSTIPDVRDQWAVGVGFLPGLEGGAAYSNENVPGSLLWRDITLHGKLRLLREQRGWPSVAIGASNLRPAAGDPNYYIVGSKTLWQGRARASAGVGSGELSGPFGGIEIDLAPWAQAMAEWDGDRVNTGLRLRPIQGLQVDIADLPGGLSTQAAYAFEIGDVEHPSSPPVELAPASEEGTAQEIADRVAQSVVDLGMENVQIAIGERPEGLELGATYENRRYYQDEIEALGAVLAAVAKSCPANVISASLVVLDHQVPVLRLTVGLSDYRDYLAGRLSGAELAGRWTVDAGLEPQIHPSLITAKTDRRADTRLTVDLSFTPTFRSIVGSEEVSLALRTALRSEADVDLGSGWQIRAADELRLINHFGDLDRYYSDDFLNLNYSARLGPSLLTHVAGGEFADDRRGIAAEAFVLPGSGPFLLRGYAGCLEDRRFGSGVGYEWSYLGDARYWFSGPNMEASVTAGKYLDLDQGFTLGLRRFFGDHELKLEYRDTDYANVLLAQATVALGPRRYPRPGRVRFRLGDHIGQGWRSVASGEDTTLDIASLVGNQLRFFDLSDAFLNRDRFNAQALRERVDLLRRTAAPMASQ
jgi:hypothetical protein